MKRFLSTLAHPQFMPQPLKKIIVSLFYYLSRISDTYRCKYKCG